MARVSYKGFNLPDGTEIPDVPADLQRLVDGGAIPRFANLAALQAALTPAVAGMIGYTADTQRYWYYSGSAWTRLTRTTISGYAQGTTNANGELTIPYGVTFVAPSPAPRPVVCNGNVTIANSRNWVVHCGTQTMTSVQVVVANSPTGA